MAIQEHVFADFGGGLNLSASLDKLPNRECILADNCIFDELGNVSAGGAATLQNSGSYSDSGALGIHSLHFNPTIRHIAGVAHDVFQGTAIGSLAMILDEANSAQQKMTFADYLDSVYFETNNTPRFIKDDGTAHTVDWVEPISSVTVGPTSAGAGADGGAGLTPAVAWANPGNVVTSNNVYATTAAMTGGYTNYLQATTFGFVIPAGSTILGIKVEIEGSTVAVPAGEAFLGINHITLLKGGISVGNSLASYNPITNVWTPEFPNVTDAYVSAGSSSELWGTTWTVAEINVAGFGVQFSGRYQTGQLPPGASLTPSIDHIRITIYYSGGPTVALGAAGNPNGAYTYRVTFTDADGHESDGGPASASISPVSQIVNLSAIATGDSKTTGRNIYRKGALLTFYYKVGEISDNTATTFADNYSDTQALVDGIILAGEVEGDKANTRIGASAAVRFPCVHYSRIFWADQTAGQQNKLKWSKVNQPFAYPAAHSIDVGDTKPITGILVFLDDLIIIKTDSIWRLSGNTESAFQLVRTPSSEGCDIPFSIVKLTDRILFTNQKGIWFFDGVTSRSATNRLDKFFNGQTVNGLLPPSSNFTTLGCATVSSGKYYLLYPTNSGVQYNDRILVVDMDGGTISMRVPALGLLSIDTDPVIGDVYVGTYNGFVYKIDDPSVTLGWGSSLSWAFQSKFYDQKRGSNKSYVGLELEIDTSSQSVTPTVYFDGDTATGVALTAVSTAKRDVVYVPIVTAAARKARSISIRVSATLATINESGSPAVTLYGGKIYIEELKQRSRTSVG